MKVEFTFCTVDTITKVVHIRNSLDKTKKNIQQKVYICVKLNTILCEYQPTTKEPYCEDPMNCIGNISKELGAETEDTLH